MYFKTGIFLCREGDHEGSKCPKKNKDSSMSKSGNSNIDHSRKKVKCWLFPQTRARIISKDYKKGKYYNKKVKINIIINYTIGLAFPLLLL